MSLDSPDTPRLLLVELKDGYKPQLTGDQASQMRESSVFLKISLSHSADVSRMQPKKHVHTLYLCICVYIFRMQI